MKNSCRKLVAAFCAVSMFMTLPGISVYAADTHYEDIGESIEAMEDKAEIDGDFPEEDSVYEEPDPYSG